MHPTSLKCGNKNVDKFSDYQNSRKLVRAIRFYQILSGITRVCNCVL